jgi:CubicO group peptidase (beta-lactamase class C family)
MQVLTLHRRFQLIALILIVTACLSGRATWGDVYDSEAPIVPKDGYEWSDRERMYWPTEEWMTGRAVDNGFDQKRLRKALKEASQDGLMRAVLIVRNGRLVVEEYFNGGAKDQSTEVWSVTKSIVSALIGIALHEKYIGNIDDPMAKYLPEYPEFGNLTIRHVLTHTTGLEWTEEGDDFIAWIASPDPIANAIHRKRQYPPGEKLRYSSGNSHFLSALITNATQMTPGEYALENIFEPLGIEFSPQQEIPAEVSWDGLLLPMPNTWKRDRLGVELGAFGLSMTARDMARFGYLYLNKGQWDGKRIIDESWVIESTRDHVRRSDNFGFGYHWVVSRRGGQLAFNADGWGGQIICVIPSLDMVVVLKSEAESPAAHAYYDILSALIEAGIQ